ncbi:hypothetical protein K3712_000539 [Escherichia coli]|nr:hypothetical protein [Escherichia coli]
MEVKKQKGLLEILESKKNSEKVDQLFDQVWSLKAYCEPYRSQYVTYFNDANLYYYGMLPRNTLETKSGGGGEDFHNQSSRKEFVDQVLKRTVDADLANHLDAFTNNKSLAVAFRSRGWRLNPEQEQHITLEVNKHFRENDGYSIIRNALKTLCISGNADLKVFIDESTETDSVPLGDNWIESNAFLQGLDEGWTVNPPKNFTDKSGKFKGFEWKEETEEDRDPQTGKPVEIPVLFISGDIPIIKKTKKLILEEIEPHDIWYDVYYGSQRNKLRYACQRIRTTVGEAEKHGFDPDKLVNATDERQDYAILPDFFFSSVNYQDPTYGATGRLEENASVDPKERKICLYEHYVHSSLPNKKGETRLYQVVTTNTEILKIEEVKRIPFVHGVLEDVQGQFFGRGWFDVCKPFQDANSISHRLHEQKAIQSTWPQYIAVKGQYDRQSLLNNRPGAVIEQLAQGMVDRFPPQEISQTYLTAIQNLKEIEQETLAQPLALANADGGIPQISTATAYLSIFQDSQKGAIRKDTIEQTFINPLFSLMYETLRDEEMIIDTNGKPVSAKMLPKLYECIVDSDTTHDDFAQQLQLTNFVGMAMQLSQTQAGYLTEQNKHNVLKALLEKADIDSGLFLTDPSTIPQDPHAAQEQAEQQAIMSEFNKVKLQREVVAMRKDAADVAKTEAETENLIRETMQTSQQNQIDSHVKMQKILSDAQNKARENEIKAAEVEVKDRQVSNDTILQAHKQAYEINANRVNGRLS